jgi:hypothetical protein
MPAVATEVIPTPFSYRLISTKRIIERLSFDIRRSIAITL